MFFSAQKNEYFRFFYFLIIFNYFFIHNSLKIKAFFDFY